ncbi:MAG: hypothetical protein RJB38_1349 [Pseudomonadota bacterium]
MKIGISSPRSLSLMKSLGSPAWISQFDGSEWPLEDLLALSLRQRLRIRKSLETSTHRLAISIQIPWRRLDLEALRERVVIAGELCREFQAQALSTKISETLDHQEAPEFFDDVFREITHAIPNKVELWLDPGKLGRTRVLPRTRWIWDPFWHATTDGTRNGVWKAHGWHDSRWIRYYGALQLQTLLKRVARLRPEWIFFSHSMRDEEAATFRSLVTESIRRARTARHSPDSP